MEDLVRIRNAVFSLSEKAGASEFARALAEFGVTMMATGGTYDSLRTEGVQVKSLQEDMKLPTAVSGRVKTLHAPLQAAILAKGNKHDLDELAGMGVAPVDMVVCNFYPFEEALRKAGAGDSDLVESIDIGGPTMVRGAAKNFERVTVVPSPRLYPAVLAEMKRTGGSTSLEFRKRLAVEAFSITSAYDASVFGGLRRGDRSLPDRFLVSATKVQEAKYGENPDARAVIYGLDGWRTMGDWKLIAGDPLSFNNYLDVGGAYKILEGFEDTPAVATVKHGQISGFALAPTVAEAYRLAHACDPEADFGGTVVANRELGEDAARLIGRNEGAKDSSVYTEIVMAPGFTRGALEILESKQKKRIRVVEAKQRPDYPFDVKVVEGALLVQDAVDYRVRQDGSKLTVPTRKQPGGGEMELLLASWEVVRRVQSNGIVVASGELEGGRLVRFWTLGVASFRKRNGAVKIALDNAGARAKGAVCASDGFFPFRDSVDLMGAAGVTAVIQPGGSVKDADSVTAADEHGMAMVFTHTRAFKH